MIAKAIGSLGVSDVQATAPFLATLLGIEAQLPAGVREDVKVLSESMRRAFLRWLDALTQSGPLAIIIDDAQWVDATSISWLLDSYSSLAERPLFVAIFARPEVIDSLPALQRVPSMVRVPLPPLPRKAAERLAKHVLGDAAAPELIARLVSRADGNAFYLEELLRLAARGATDDFPATVLAMAQTRLEGLSPEERKVLRAASIFGERFWTDALVTLVGMDLRGTLDALVEHEVIERSPTTRFAPHDEFAFRHALLRDAAFASLTDGDRKRGHGLAANWLADHGERDPLVLAMHWEAAGERDLAREKVLQGLELVYATGDTRAMHSLVERAKRLGASGAELGRVLAFECAAWGLVLNYENAIRCAEESIALVDPGSEPWFLAASAIFMGAYFGVVSPAFPDMLTQLIVMPESSVSLTGLSGSAFTFALVGLAEMGMTDARDALLARFHALRATAPPDGPFDAWGNAAGCIHSYLGQVGIAGLKGREAFRQFEILGDRLGLATVGSYHSLVLASLGSLEDARTFAEAVFRNGETQGPLAQAARMSLVQIELLENNIEAARRWIAEMDKEESITVRIWASICRADLALHEGRLEDVEKELAEVLPIPSQIVPILTTGIRAEALLRMGRREEAAQAAREVRTVVPPGIFGWHCIRLWKVEMDAEGPSSPAYAEIAKGVREIVLRVAEEVSPAPDLLASWFAVPLVADVLEQTGGRP
jgi:hypothetical protein